MLLRNVNKVNGLGNGRRISITNLYECMSENHTVTEGEHSGKQVIVPRIKLNYSVTTLPFSQMGSQFPVQ